MSESENVMVISNQGSLDIACTYRVPPNLMLRGWAFLAELDSPPLQILRRSRGSLLRVVGAKVEPVDEVVVAAPGLDLPKPRNGGDAHVG